MNRTRASLAGAVAAVVFSTTAFASSAGSIPVITMAAQAGASNNDALLLLLDQFTALRAEMETLRGMVEEQGYVINRLQQDSQARYTDLDSRISALYQELDAVAPASGANAVTAVQQPAQQPSAQAGSVPGSIPSSVAPATPAPSAIAQQPSAVAPSVPAGGLAAGSTPPVML